MSRLLAIDPGPTESGWALVELETRRPIRVGKTANLRLLEQLRLRPADYALVLEKVEGYGMPVGVEVFETCVWTGRFMEASGREAARQGRKKVKRHFCGTTTATDTNVTRALVDRFAPGASNYGKGTKAQPGWFYGFAGDMWQAYALAVYHADVLEGLT